MREYKRRCQHKRAPPGTPLWERLPDELVERIVGYVRQRLFSKDYGRTLRQLLRVRLVNRALADGLHTVLLLRVPTAHPDHVDAFAEGLARIAWDLFDAQLQQHHGNAHIAHSHQYHWSRHWEYHHAELLRKIVRRAWFQTSPIIMLADYQRAVRAQLRILVETGVRAPATGCAKDAMAKFIGSVLREPCWQLRDNSPSRIVLQSMEWAWNSSTEPV
tara:strand:+ start:880 stop:1530 length:651 start_codon:yes stop_codon:yes gene_type:complete